MTRKERDRQLRKGDILKAAEHIFATKGFHQATIQDIAKEAQYATGTIYLYFKDKEALYMALLEEKIQLLLSYVKEKIKTVRKIDDKIKILVLEQLSYFEENQDFFRIYFSEQEGMSWTIKNKLSTSAVDRFMLHLDFMSSLIKEAQEASILRDDVDSKRLAWLLSSLLNGVVLRWLRNGSNKKEGLVCACDSVFDIFLNGAGKKR